MSKKFLQYGLESGLLDGCHQREEKRGRLDVLIERITYRFLSYLESCNDLITATQRNTKKKKKVRLVNADVEKATISTNTYRIATS